MSQILIIASYYQFWPENLLESRKNVRSLNPGEWSACFEPGNPLKSEKPFLTHWISLQINPPNHMRFYKNFYFILPMYALFNLVALIVLLNCFYCPIVFRELFNCEASHHSWSFNYHFPNSQVSILCLFLFLLASEKCCYKICLPITSPKSCVTVSL